MACASGAARSQFTGIALSSSLSDPSPPAPAYNRAMPRHANTEPDHAAVGRAQALIRAGRAADAITLLEHAIAAAPPEPAGWVALAVARSLVGDHARAIEAASRAIALAPRSSAVHLAHGDVLRMSGDIGAARRAYATAVDLAPADADALNKLAGCERIERDLDAAQGHLERAVAAAPDHPYAHVNLGTLAVERQAPDEARRRLTAALALPRLPPDAANEATATLAMLDEATSLAPAIARARVERRPDAIRDALAARGDAPRRNDAWLARFDDAVAQALVEPPDDAAFARGSPRSPHWPAIEAHHNLRSLGGPDRVGRSIELAASGGTDAPTRELLDYAAMVALHGRDPFPLDDGIAWEAALRYAHAGLLASQPASWPGQLKLVNNRLGIAERTPRTPPHETAGTIREVAARVAKVPDPTWRACLLYVAIVEIHPFRDGNGRLARHVLNRVLAGAGFFPSLRPDNDEGPMAAVLNLDGDLRTIEAWFARGTRYAADLDRGWATP